MTCSRQALRLTVNIRRDSLFLWLLVNIYLNFCAKCLRNVYKKITIVYKLLTDTSLFTTIHVYVVTLILVTICSTAYCLPPPMISYIRASLQVLNSNGILAYEMFTNTLQLFTNYLLILGCLRLTAYSPWVPPPGVRAPPLGSPRGNPPPPGNPLGTPLGRGALSGFSGTCMR